MELIEKKIRDIFALLQDAESINVELIILNFYSLGSPWEIDMGKCLHVLDVVRKGALLHDSDYRRPHRRIWGRTRPSKRRYSIILPSASELHEAGIHFEKSKSTCLTDVSFRRGVLSLPTIVVDDAAESMFLNLVAFELLHVRAGNEVMVTYTQPSHQM